MKNTFFRALLASALMACTLNVMASEQSSVSAGDMNWMKQQQQTLDDFKQRLQGATMQLPAEQQALIEKLQGDIGRQQAGQQAGEKRTFPAIYFVSLGLPREGLLPMLKDANRYGIPATLRGLVNNDLRQTASAMFELAKEDKNIGVQIDPTLYTEYHITAIPALVVTCSGRYDVIRGSLPLKDALERIAKDGDCAETAKRLLKEAE
ncbi:conjugal transfer pilus assembly protein TrbC [Citrobacter amalonaticus]|uniref:type-F conjugative transfer system pilin assembly protein TrbC n=1 Tax=Citrobacter amalonaticus TaxID=35703 RepID=UPI000E1A11AC|nr:type-F conjugative transfer system pilin assembly protein TrbC [Citrobacter amalonaticus]UBI23036.1 type-F conjugative transfer system pilin assembly protein TrbC [Citrobacter amalonaticus]BCU50940.1 conjugal transfer pilus assembly protein TrbC [Citrobacter amalonaticus]STA63079.1 conjugal transfer pilus assembly protein TrbC [Citrobacter amalonaticus]